MARKSRKCPEPDELVTYKELLREMEANSLSPGSSLAHPMNRRRVGEQHLPARTPGASKRKPSLSRLDGDHD